MELMADLWLPILVSAAAVWVYSALAWMVLPHHAQDMQRAPDEDALIAAVRGLGLRPGTYGFPECKSRAERSDPKFIEKWKSGPSGLLRVWSPVNMGRNMLLSLVVYALVSVGVAYIGATALPRGDTFLHVLRVLGTAGIMAYLFGSLPNAIWFQTPRPAVISCAVDAIIQGLITGAIFAWLWPAVA